MLPQLVTARRARQASRCLRPGSFTKVIKNNSKTVHVILVCWAFKKEDAPLRHAGLWAGPHPPCKAGSTQQERPRGKNSSREGPQGAAHWYMKGGGCLGRDSLHRGRLSGYLGGARDRVYAMRGSDAPAGRKLSKEYGWGLERSGRQPADVQAVWVGEGAAAGALARVQARCSGAAALAWPAPPGRRCARRRSPLGRRSLLLLGRRQGLEQEVKPVAVVGVGVLVACRGAQARGRTDEREQRRTAAAPEAAGRPGVHSMEATSTASPSPGMRPGSPCTRERAARVSPWLVGLVGRALVTASLSSLGCRREARQDQGKVGQGRGSEGMPQSRRWERARMQAVHMHSGL